MYFIRVSHSKIMILQFIELNVFNINLQYWCCLAVVGKSKSVRLYVISLIIELNDHDH